MPKYVSHVRARKSISRFLMLCWLTFGVAPALATIPVSGYTKVWEGNFSISSAVNGKPNPNYWRSYQPNNHVSTAPGNTAIYRTNAHYVALPGTGGDGKLRVLAYTQNNKHYTSWITTRDKQDWTQGYFEARVRFVTRPGTWSAWWVHGANIAPNPPTPAEVDGVEMDIVEHRRHDINGNDIRTKAASTFHWDGYGSDHKTLQDINAIPGGNEWAWHTYGLQWTGSHHKIFIDNQEVFFTGSQVPISDAAQFLNFSMGLGDGGWAGDIPAGGYGAYNDLSKNSYFEVDWVRVWQKNNSSNAVAIPEPAITLPLVLSAFFWMRRRSA